MGKILDHRFELCGPPLGRRSNMVEIYAAYDLLDKRKPVIIKRPAAPATPQARQVRQERLQKDAALLNGLARLGTVPRVLKEASDPPYYFVMEDVCVPDQAGRMRVALSKRLADPTPFSAIEALSLLKEIAELVNVLEMRGLVHGKLVAENLFWDRGLGLKVVGWDSGRQNCTSDLRSLISRLLPEITKKVVEWPNPQWKDELRTLRNDFQLNRRQSYNAASFLLLVHRWLDKMNKESNEHKALIKGASPNDIGKVRSRLEWLRQRDPTDPELAVLEQKVRQLEFEQSAQRVWTFLKTGDWPRSQKLIQDILQEEEPHQATRIAYWLSLLLQVPPPGGRPISALLSGFDSLPPEAHELWQAFRMLYLSEVCDSEVVHLLLAETRSPARLPLSLRISYLHYALNRLAPPPGVSIADLIATHWQALYSPTSFDLPSIIAAYQALANELKQLKASGWHWPPKSKYNKEKWEQWAEQARHKLADLDRAIRQTEMIVCDLQDALKAQAAHDKVMNALKSAYHRDRESRVLVHLRHEAMEMDEFLKEIEQGSDPDEALPQYMDRVKALLLQKAYLRVNYPIVEAYLTWFENDAITFQEKWHQLQPYLQKGWFANPVPSLKQALEDALKSLDPPLRSALQNSYLTPSRERIKAMRQARKAVNKAVGLWNKGKLKDAQEVLAQVTELPPNSVIAHQCYQVGVKAVLDLETGVSIWSVKADLEEFKSKLSNSDLHKISSDKVLNKVLDFAWALMEAYEQAAKGNLDATRQRTNQLLTTYSQHATWPTVAQLQQVIAWMEALQQARQAFSSGRWSDAPQLLQDANLLPASLLHNELKELEVQARLLRRVCDGMTQALQAWQQGAYQAAHQEAHQSELDANTLQEVDPSAVQELANTLQRVVEALEKWTPPKPATKPDPDAVRKPLELIIEQEKAYRAFLAQPTQSETRLKEINDLLQHLNTNSPSPKI